MANPAIRGRGVVHGASGQLVLAGSITILNATQSGSITNADETYEIKDSTGKVSTVVNVEDLVDVEFEIIPGGTAATLANAISQSAIVRKNDKLVTTAFAVADYNSTFRVMEVSSHITNTGALTYRVKARKNEADFSAAALSA